MYNPSRLSAAIIYFCLAAPLSALGQTRSTTALPDSLHGITIPRYASRDTFLVVGKKVTLREIIRRSVAGERGKLGGHSDMTYTMTERNIVRWKNKMKQEDQVMRAYSDIHGNNRTLQLDETTRTFERDGDDWIEKEEDEDPAPVRLSVGGIEESPPSSLVELTLSVIAGEILSDREVVLQRLRRLGVLCVDAPVGTVSTELVDRYLEIKRRELV